MPVYEYRCNKGHDYEKTESFSAPAEQKCIVCGAKARRQISKPAVIFKGSGFYSTDNRRSSGALSNSSSDSDAGSEPPLPSASADNGHGHSHGPGGHSHDKPEKPTKSSKKSESKAG
jgi:putative FmdB family regulatory protein